MACNTISGAFTGNTCKNGMGGIKTLWIADADTMDSTVDTANSAYTCTSFRNDSETSGAMAEARFWKFELPIDIGDAVEDVNADPKLGTSFVAQTLNATLLGLAKEYSKELSGMMKGKQAVIAELYNGMYIIYGVENGLDLTGGGSRTGTEAASLQGYELTWTGTERDYAPFVVSPTTTDPDFITIA